MTNPQPQRPSPHCRCCHLTLACLPRHLACPGVAANEAGPSLLLLLLLDTCHLADGSFNLLRACPACPEAALADRAKRSRRATPPGRCCHLTLRSCYLAVAASSPPPQPLHLSLCCCCYGLRTPECGVPLFFLFHGIPTSDSGILLLSPFTGNCGNNRKLICLSSYRAWTCESTLISSS